MILSNETLFAFQGSDTFRGSDRNITSAIITLRTSYLEG